MLVVFGSLEAGNLSPERILMLSGESTLLSETIRELCGIPNAFCNDWLPVTPYHILIAQSLQKSIRGATKLDHTSGINAW